MQNPAGLRVDSSFFIKSIPDDPFTTGISSEVTALPIIGPPPIILPVSSGKPSAASIS